ncbi:MAG TPA: nucleotidyltransferase family protein [Legionella sp.]|nr:nucleotidyltransferase family protein [Legionella sp.]
MKTAMILAAGRGERLRPLTDLTPKALCKVQGTPLIEYHVAHLAQAGFDRIVINHAYLGGQIRRRLGTGEHWGIEIRYAPEPPGGLETGGGIFNALPLLGDKPFLTVNADIFTDFDFETLALPIQSGAHLVLIKKPDYQSQGDFGLSSTGRLNNTHRQYTFAGIACYRPGMFHGVKPGRYSVTPLLRRLAMDGQATGTVYTGTWIDIGSPARLMQAQSYGG